MFLGDYFLDDGSERFVPWFTYLFQWTEHPIFNPKSESRETEFLVNIKMV